MARWAQGSGREAFGVAMIDVLLPYYGDSPHFRLAVESIIAQTMHEWRLICIEDASPDGDASAWLSSIGDDRIIHHKNAANLGVAGNFSRSLDFVKAPYFQVMGSDDIMLPDHLEAVREAASHYPSAAMVQPGVRVIDSQGKACHPLADIVKAALRPRERNSQLLLSNEALASSLTRADWAYFPSILWRADAVLPIGFKASYEIALDLGLMLDLTLAGHAMLVTSPTTFEYRRHRASASMTSARNGLRFEQEKEFFIDYATKFDEVGWSTAARISKRHLVSRLNALTEIPAALLSRDKSGVSRLFRHVVT